MSAPRGGLSGSEGVRLRETHPRTAGWGDDGGAAPSSQPGPPRLTPTPPSTPSTPWARPKSAPGVLKRLPGSPRQVEIGRRRAAQALLQFHTRAATQQPPLIIPHHPPLAAILRCAREERIHAYETAGKAALDIQRVWRGTSARLRCIILLEREQAVAVRVSEHWMRKASLIKAQSVVRARRHRRAFLALRHAVLTIQRAWRFFAGAVVRALRKEQEAAALRIQTKLRMRVKRREFIHMRERVLHIQKLARMRRAHVEYRSMRTTALLLQSRKRRARKQFSVRHFLAAQRMWRDSLDRRKFKSLWDECTLATVMIQSKFRVKVARMRFTKIRNAAVRIQSMQRGRLVRRDYEEIKQGALRMLPNDLMEIVFSFLSARSLSKARLVWKPWNKVAAAESLWRQASILHYGEQLACATSTTNGWRAPCVTMGLLSKIQWLDMGQPLPGRHSLPPMPCSRQGHSMTAVSSTEAVLLFGKDGPGTQGDMAMHSTSHYILTARSGTDCQMRWNELKIDAAGDWRWQVTEMTPALCPPARWGHTATLISPGLIVVFGGFGEDYVMDDVWLLQVGPTQSDHEIIDLSQPSGMTGRWIKPQVKGSRPSARAFHSATMVPGVGIVLFGGLNATGRAHRDAFVLTVLPNDDAQNAPWRVHWKTADSCRWPRAGHTAVFHPKRGLFFVGGMTRTREGKDVFRSDACMLRVGAWQLLGARMKWMYSDSIRLPARRCMASTLIGSRLMLFGGCESQHCAHQQKQTSQLLEDKQRLCNDILVVDLNVCFRSMKSPASLEEQQQRATATLPPQEETAAETENLCLYHRVHPATPQQGKSWLEDPTNVFPVEGEEAQDQQVARTQCVHGGVGGVESAGFAQIGAHFVICGGTTQTKYATLGTLNALSCLRVHE